MGLFSGSAQVRVFGEVENPIKGDRGDDSISFAGLISATIKSENRRCGKTSYLLKSVSQNLISV